MNALVALAAVPSLLVAWSVGLAMRTLARRWNLVDTPGRNKIHTRPTPYGGGLAIWAGIVAPLALVQIPLRWWASSYQQSPNDRWLESLGPWATALAEFVEPHLPGLVERSADLGFFLAAATVLMVLGLIDDTRKLDWRLRLVVEVAVAAVVVFGRGWALTLFVDWPLATRLISVVWIVWLINAFNMLDNMDGLSAGVAAIAATLLAIVMLSTPEGGSGQPQLFVAGFLFVLVGALIGFLFHNRPPARLFMGDAGAYLVGFCLGVSTILATFSGGGLPRHAILAPLCVLAVPLYDTLSVITIRLRAGRSPFEGDTSHFSHRLVALGLSKTQAVLTIYLMSAACGLGALLLHQVDAWGAAVVLLMIGCLLSVVAILEATGLGRMPP
jgi:UDP-GlcNAc:undecaprenyl-phosphate/decaprenyl-phosphate GlcNAc-1-phosphate transferase